MFLKHQMEIHEKNYILKYIQIEKLFQIVKVFHYCFYCIF